MKLLYIIVPLLAAVAVSVDASRSEFLRGSNQIEHLRLLREEPATNTQTLELPNESTSELELTQDPEPDESELEGTDEPELEQEPDGKELEQEQELKPAPLPDCIDEDCHHGSCYKGRCKCDKGWGGDFCDMLEPDDTLPDCIDEDCIQGSCYKGRCKCDEGWVGDFCDEPEPPPPPTTSPPPPPPPPDCTDDDCIHGRCENGRCKCKDGWGGETCDIERCGEVDGGCGNHGKCRHDECECHDGWKGNDCDTKITYRVKFIATSLDSRSRSAEDCGDELYDFMNMLDDESKHHKLGLDKVTTLELPSECGDFDFDTTRFMVREVINHDHDHDGGKRYHDHDDDEPILVMLVFDDSSEKSVDDYTCVDNMVEAADEISRHMKPHLLKELDGSIVYMDYEECGDEDDIEWILYEEVD